MYERFTNPARRVMQIASAMANKFNHEYIGTEHILLALIELAELHNDYIACRVFFALRVDLQRMKDYILEVATMGPELALSGKLPSTPRAKKVIEYAMEEARIMKHNHVGTEHLLIGLSREGDGLAAQALLSESITVESILGTVLALHPAGIDLGMEEAIVGHILSSHEQAELDLLVQQLKLSPGSYLDALKISRKYVAAMLVFKKMCDDAKVN